MWVDGVWDKVDGGGEWRWGRMMGRVGMGISICSEGVARRAYRRRAPLRSHG